MSYKFNNIAFSENRLLKQSVLCILALLANCPATAAAEPTHAHCHEATVTGIYEQIHTGIFVEMNLGPSKPSSERWVETYITGNVAGRVGLIQCKHCGQLRTGNPVDICNRSGNPGNIDRFNNWPVNHQLEVRPPGAQRNIGNKTGFVPVN